MYDDSIKKYFSFSFSHQWSTLLPVWSDLLIALPRWGCIVCFVASILATISRSWERALFDFLSAHSAGFCKSWPANSLSSFWSVISVCDSWAAIPFRNRNRMEYDSTQTVWFSARWYTNRLILGTMVREPSPFGWICPVFYLTCLLLLVIACFASCACFV